MFPADTEVKPIKVTLKWPERFALIERYKPTDTAIRLAFGISQSELDVARNLLLNGTFKINPNFDVEAHSSIFSGAGSITSKPATASASVTTSGTRIVRSNTTVHDAGRTMLREAQQRPESARRTVPERSGRSCRIITAFHQVPEVPTPALAFCEQHNISIHVARQSKRFLEKQPADVIAQIGTIHVRQQRETKCLMIWREIT